MGHLVALVISPGWDFHWYRKGREPHRDPPPLGYRGCLLRAPDGRAWRSSGGLVTLADGRLTDLRADPGGRFERLLLATAPPGILPPV